MNLRNTGSSMHLALYSYDTLLSVGENSLFDTRQMTCSLFWPLKNFRSLFDIEFNFRFLYDTPLDFPSVDR